MTRFVSSRARRLISRISLFRRSCAASFSRSIRNSPASPASAALVTRSSRSSPSSPSVASSGFARMRRRGGAAGRDSTGSKDSRAGLGLDARLVRLPLQIRRAVGGDLGHDEAIGNRGSVEAGVDRGFAPVSQVPLDPPDALVRFVAERARHRSAADSASERGYVHGDVTRGELGLRLGRFPARAPARGSGSGFSSSGSSLGSGSGSGGHFGLRVRASLRCAPVW